MVPTQRRQRNLAQSVIEQVGAAVKQGILKPGDKLPTESSLMAQHGVSRTVVREAISHLQASGLVQTRHGIGTFVLERPQTGLGLDAEHILTLRDVLAILELRIGVETETAGLAASRRSEEQVRELAGALDEMQQAMAEGISAVEADKRFHLLIAQATGNRYFVDILAQLGNAIIPRARLNTPGLEQDKPADFLERVSREHDDIFRAIERRDPEAARAAMRTHLSNSRERLVQAQRRLENAIG
ncbi:FadR family transcriptional regulator [Oxalobacteraceae sp. CFBP 8755]|jgi:DNA-binding FadR family transcriptional regulator|nr:FadR family transcriptional regulator [Oxalobacteraceae sp. CFBP 8761]MBD8631580.1 FadR family transcriptional regulator [Oxalobacteraceae sp. CFBP 8755]MBD8723743.1 FadR family transcriptional regulator [Oxalobacteraceae sp. CFBP 13708]